MDGCGLAKDNIGIARFWETIKYEYIYILPEESIEKYLANESNIANKCIYKGNNAEIDNQFKIGFG